MSEIIYYTGCPNEKCNFDMDDDIIWFKPPRFGDDFNCPYCGLRIMLVTTVKNDIVTHRYGLVNKHHERRNKKHR